MVLHLQTGFNLLEHSNCSEHLLEQKMEN